MRNPIDGSSWLIVLGALSACVGSYWPSSRGICVRWTDPYNALDVQGVAVGMVSNATRSVSTGSGVSGSDNAFGSVDPARGASSWHNLRTGPPRRHLTTARIVIDADPFPLARGLLIPPPSSAPVESNALDWQAKGLTPVKQAGKWGYADADGRVVIAPQFLSAREFFEGLAAVQVEVSPPSKIGFVDSRGVRAIRAAPRKWGFIGQSGTMAIPPRFEAVGNFSEGLAAASLADPRSNEGTWGYIDTQGRVVIKPQFSSARPFSEGLALVSAGGIRLADPSVPSIVNIGFIDRTGEWVIRSKFKYFFYDDFSSGLVPFRKNLGKWGYMDKAGTIVLNPRFDWAGRFTVNGFAPVVVNGKCAHIDRLGRVVGPTEPLEGPWGKGKLARRIGTFTFKPDPAPCS